MRTPHLAMLARPLRLLQALRLRAVLLVALVCLAVFLALAWPLRADAQRLKEIAAVQGVRSNQLIGYGLVLGLDGSGDQPTQAPFTTQSLQAMLEQMGVTLPPGIAIQPKNVAGVIVTAELPAFAQPGQRIDITVASIGNAKSLRGGTLVATPMRGVDGQIYAMAQGSLIVGGAGASAGGSKVQINHLSAGRVPQGASVERTVASPLGQGEFVQLDLDSADYATAREVARAINAAKGEGTASAVDGRVVRVRAPLEPGARVAFMADIEDLPISRTKAAAKVVINARTGSVVMNDAVTLSACAVAHGSLSVTISTTPVISQPGPFAQGQTVQAEKSDIAITQTGGNVMLLPAGAKLADVVKALNSIGASPLDLLAILQGMKSAGALKAELEVI